MADVRRVWITRAQPGAERTADRLTALGFTPLVIPLLAIRPLEVALDLAGVDALAFTSTNGVSTFAALSGQRALPVLTVGDATARAAREAGFADVRSADGDLTALAALIRTEARGLTILTPTAAQPAGDLAALVGGDARIKTVAVYETMETGAAPPDGWDTVLIHSPRAARALVATSPRTGSHRAVAISPAAAAPLFDLGFAEVRIATAPTEDALLVTLSAGGVTALGKPRPGV